METLKAMYPICSLIKSDGTRCGSPALTGMNLCYQHIGGGIGSAARPAPQTRSTPLDFIYPSGHEAIQHNLFLVVQALSEGKIDNATALTYNRLFRSAQLNLHRWQAAKSKLNQDEVEQQMMPCAPAPTPAPARSPASNGCHPERTGVPDQRSLLAGVETGAPDTRDVRVTGLGSAERALEEPVLSEGKEPAFCESAKGPSVSSADFVVKNENETPGELNAERRSLSPDQPREFKPFSLGTENTTSSSTR